MTWSIFIIFFLVGCGDEIPPQCGDEIPPQCGDEIPPQSLSGTRGFVNLGNTCFFNSVMQLLLSAPPVIRAKFLMENRRQSSGSLGSPILDEFLQVANERWNAPAFGTPLNPAKFFSVLSDVNPELFEIGIQQDANEALVSIYENLREAAGFAVPEMNAELQFFDFSSTNRVFCIDQGLVLPARSERQNQIIVSLPESAADPVTLESCIGRAFNAFEIERLESCTAAPSQAANSTPTFESFPALLLVAARRNIYGLPKISTRIRVEPDLDLSSIPRREGTGKPPKYSLIGIVHHHGRWVDSGHYTAEYKDPYTGEWFDADDGVVSPIDGPSQDTSTGYMFLYYSH